VTITGVGVTPLPVAPGGTDSGFGIRMKMSISSRGVSVPFNMDILSFGVGRDEISLLVAGVAESFPHQTEQRLSSLLVNRALANPH